VKNNENQRNEPKRLGGITGRGFMPGQSGNPSGRPRTRGLLGTLRVKVAEIGTDGRSLERTASSMCSSRKRYAAGTGWQP
jgi:hypothetical protein